MGSHYKVKVIGSPFSTPKNTKIDFACISGIANYNKIGRDILFHCCTKLQYEDIYTTHH
jgi:hypothetical protein